jgi:hypothetical protein
VEVKAAAGSAALAVAGSAAPAAEGSAEVGSVAPGVVALEKEG